MLKILCVCGCGLGSSFAIEMTAKAVLKKLEIPAHIEHTTVSEAGAFKSDMILTQKTFADILTADASEEEIKRVTKELLNGPEDKEILAVIGDGIDPDKVISFYFFVLFYF